MELGVYDTQDTFYEAVQSIPLVNGGSRTGNALSTVVRRMTGKNSGRRMKTPMVTVLITDSTSLDDIVTPCSFVHENSAVVVVGIGPLCSREELQIIASRPSEDFVHIVKTSDVLLRSSNKVANSICKGKGEYLIHWNASNPCKLPNE